MNFAKGFGALVIALGLAAATAMAAPITIGIGDFSGGETVVDFNSIGNEVLITNQFAGDGVKFSGALYGMTNIGDLGQFPAPGGVIASNWLYSQGGNQGLSFTASFASLQNRVGFLSETNTGDGVSIEVFNGLASLGTLNFLNTTGLTAQFRGLENLSGFDRAVITVQDNFNGFLAIDDFRFEATNPVPEPASLALFGLGMVGLGAYRRRKSRLAS